VWQTVQRGFFSIVAPVNAMQAKKKYNAHKTNTTGVKRWFSIFSVH
jgi:hypothetical protein